MSDFLNSSLRGRSQKQRHDCPDRPWALSEADVYLTTFNPSECPYITRPQQSSYLPSMAGSDTGDSMNVLLFAHSARSVLSLPHDPASMLTGFLPNTHLTGGDVTHTSVL
ncbi:hypothetical protein BDW75DRAFT_209901 [Aspergillus navahoensis]